MANLTAKELTGLSDQLDFEKVLHCKYLNAAEECTDRELQSAFRSCADRHMQNYKTLLNHLH